MKSVARGTGWTRRLNWHSQQLMPPNIQVFVASKCPGEITYPIMRWLLRAVGKDKPREVEKAADPVDTVEPPVNSAVKVVERSVNLPPKTKPAETAG